ncbi:MAG: hypothetical protein Q4C26_08390 [Bacteroidales bacterium]|nr:hypothetical protein [Bacteroidales bacterium]
MIRDGNGDNCNHDTNNQCPIEKHHEILYLVREVEYQSKSDKIAKSDKKDHP